MAVVRSSIVRKNLQILFTTGAIGDLSDGELLERFVAFRDDGAFEAGVHHRLECGQDARRVQAG
jgi:hypothetical protein